MAFSLNRAQIIGNVTRDPEARQTPSGQLVASFSIATNRVWRDKTSGDRQEQADFHNIVAWGKLAEIAQQYLKRGRKVYVEGRMQTRDWTGEDGQKRSRMEIVAENLILLDRAGNPTEEGASAPSYERAQNSTAVRQESAPMVEEEVALDDLPF
jgi:single-strand DNA-binding protein